MSVVTTIMLQFSLVEDSIEVEGEDDRIPAIEQINEWLATRTEGRGGLKRLDGPHWGGTKMPQVDLWGAAFNGFGPLDDFMAYVAAYPWEEAESVQLFVNLEDDSRFAVYLLSADRSWLQVCDGRPY